jgi:Fe-S oxidoreductase
MCPEDLNPMLINEIIKGAYVARGLANSDFKDTGAPASAHRVLASVQVSAVEYRRITTVSEKSKARYVFFPGCNVYFQPEKILHALDIMNAIGDDYAFLPGLDHCCGENHLFFGHIKGGCQRAEELVAAIRGFRPDAVVLWCPTCHCCFEKMISSAMALPFEVISFPQYLAENMNRLGLTRAAAGTVTLHEACKSAFTGVDRHGPREVLRQLPGVTLREMEHWGENTVCCGSGAACWFPASCARIREARLQEAARTGADRLVTVCHYCSQTFAQEEPRYAFRLANYIDLVAEALGIQREDTFKKYRQWGNLDRILADADRHISGAPFGRERVLEVLKAVFAG